MSDSDYQSDSDESGTKKYNLCLRNVKEAFNRRYGDPTDPNFDFEAYRRKVANEKMIPPDATWMKLADPIERRHEELVYRLKREERQVERVVKQMESVQDQLDNMKEKLLRVERCVMQTQTYLEVVVREIRQNQQQQLLMQPDEDRNINVVE